MLRGNVPKKTGPLLPRVWAIELRVFKLISKYVENVVQQMTHMTRLVAIMSLRFAEGGAITFSSK